MDTKLNEVKAESEYDRLIAVLSYLGIPHTLATEPKVKGVTPITTVTAYWLDGKINLDFKNGKLVRK